MCAVHCQPCQGEPPIPTPQGLLGPPAFPHLQPAAGWTPGSPWASGDACPILQYADPVADLLDKWGAFRARLFRESCVFHRGNYVKDLSRLGRDLRRVLILDNSPASYVFHPDNAVSAGQDRVGGREPR